MKYRFVVLCILGACNIWRSFEPCPTEEACRSVVDGAAPDRQLSSDGGSSCSDRPWGAPRPVAGLELEAIISARLSADEHTMFVSYGVPPKDTAVYAAVRDNTTSPFRLIGPVPNINVQGASQFWPSMTSSGLLMFFESSRGEAPIDAGLYASERARIWSAERVDRVADFGTPKLQALFRTDAGSEAAPYLHPSGLSLYFASNARGGKGNLDLFAAVLNESGVVVGVHNLENANTPFDENAPVVSQDELSLYFNHPGRDGSVFENDIFVSHREDKTAPFGLPTRVDAFSSEDDDYSSWVSADHCRFYFTSQRAIGGKKDGDFHVWWAERD